jgi:hypothetical protein
MIFEQKFYFPLRIGSTIIPIENIVEFFLYYIIDQ